MHICKRLIISMGVIALMPHSAGAEDVKVELDAGSDFVVEDVTQTERLNVGDGKPARIVGPVVLDGRDQADKIGALVVLGDDNGGGNANHPLVLYNEDTGDVDRRVTWLVKAGGRMMSNHSLSVDGRFDADVDPETGIVTISDQALYPDPDRSGPALPLMIAVGADVEYGMLIRAAGKGCTGCSPPRPNPSFLLMIDAGQDWVWKFAADGSLLWGDPGPTSTATSDGGRGQGSLDVKMQRIETDEDEFLRITNDLDDDGEGTRAVDLAQPHPQGTGSPDAGFVMVAGDASVAEIDSGDEVCATIPRGAGLTCQASIDPKDGSEHPCDLPHPPADATASGYFYSLCF